MVDQININDPGFAGRKLGMGVPGGGSGRRGGKPQRSNPSA